MVLLVVLLVLLIAGLPQLGYHSYGYAPSGGLILLVLLLLVFARPW